MRSSLLAGSLIERYSRARLTGVELLAGLLMKGVE